MGMPSKYLKNDEIPDEVLFNNGLATKEKKERRAYQAKLHTLYDFTTVKFYSYKGSCPICDDYLDCITKMHAGKHGLTLKELVQLCKAKKESKVIKV